MLSCRVLAARPAGRAGASPCWKAARSWTTSRRRSCWAGPPGTSTPTRWCCARVGGAGRPAHMQIFFEEANKILSGLDNAPASEEGGGPSTADQFANMWRDSRKYGIWLHLVSQSPALIPPASCRRATTCSRPSSRTRRTAMWSRRSWPARRRASWTSRGGASWPRSRWRGRWSSWATRPTAPGWSRSTSQPLLLNVREPSDEDIEAVLGRIVL